MTMTDTASPTDTVQVSNPADEGQTAVDAEVGNEGTKSEGSGSADGKATTIGHDSPAGLPYTGSITADTDGPTPNHDVPNSALLLSSGPRTRPDVLIGNEGAVQANMQAVRGPERGACAGRRG